MIHEGLDPEHLTSSLDEIAEKDGLSTGAGSAVRSNGRACGVVHADVMVRAAEEVRGALAGRLASGHAAATRSRSRSGARSITDIARFLAVCLHISFVLVGAESRAGPSGAASR